MIFNHKIKQRYIILPMDTKLLIQPSLLNSQIVYLYSVFTQANFFKHGKFIKEDFKDFASNRMHDNN